MTPAARKHDRLLALLELAGPVLALSALKLVLSATPSIAPAAMTQPEVTPPQAPTPTTAPSEAQLKASAFLESWSAPKSVRNPMHLPPAPIAQIAPEATPVPTAPDAAPEPQPKFAVGAIAGTPGNAIASINGRVHRVGDIIAPGWTIRDIDVAKRLVRVDGPGGQTIDLARRP